ncbi:MAG: glutaredoxin [Lachnospiraceae bacterium]|nr:glutaredoxin [Lachnospiraceae bacterium]
MKVTVVGSHLCPDTLYALNKLTEAGVEIDFKNLSASLPDLKVYLGLRDSEAMYEGVRAAGGIGIPCIIMEDGTKTMDVNEVLK